MKSSGSPITWVPRRRIPTTTSPLIWTFRPRVLEVALEPPAPQEELEGMIGQLDAMLEQANFFFPPDRTPATRRTLRTLLTKPAWSAREVQMLRGILTALDR